MLQWPVIFNSTIFIVNIQVRSAKKIKEKHAIWQEIGDEYNKLCARFDWPARSTEQV